MSSKQCILGQDDVGADLCDFSPNGSGDGPLKTILPQQHGPFSVIFSTAAFTGANCTPDFTVCEEQYSKLTSDLLQLLFSGYCGEPSVSQVMF